MSLSRLFFESVISLEEFPQILKDLMDKRNVSTRDLSEFLDVQIRNVQRYLKGEQLPPSDKLISIADYFDVSLDYLVGRSDDPKRY